MQEGTIVEVCPQGDDHAQAAGWVGNSCEYAFKKVCGFGIVIDERGYVLELVNDQNQLATIRRQNQLRGSQQTALISPQLFHQPGRLVDRNAQQSDLQLFERVRPR